MSGGLLAISRQESDSGPSRFLAAGREDSALRVARSR
jgi:hypothetical protein